jgi:hypothetical protein
VDDGSGKVVARSADVAVGPDGTVYVSWADERSGDADVRVARSTDGGATFEPSVALDGEEREPLVSMARRPYVAADGDRMAVVFNQQDPVGISLYVSDAGALDFGTPIALGTDLPASNFHDFPKAIFRNGEIHVAWQTYDPDGWMVLARESAGYDATEADGLSAGVPCECCPLDIAQSGDDLLLAFRNNLDNQREHWVARRRTAAP